MNKKEKIIKEMTGIETMLRGKLTKRRQGKSGGEYLALQAWHNGRNECRYVPPARAELAEKATANYARFIELAGLYADEIIKETEKLMEKVKVLDGRTKEVRSRKANG